MNRKRILFSLESLLCCLGLSACGSFFVEETSTIVVDNVSGSYSLVSAYFDEAVQLSRTGESSNDILCQMKQYGWRGVISVDGKGPLQNNVVLPTFSVDKTTQINFLVPVSMNYEREHLKAEGKCIIDLAWFQFHYRINGNGEVEFDYPEEIQLNEYDTPLKDIQIDRVSPDIIVIQAKTSFYDAGKDYSLGGRLVLVYKRNRTEVN